jgi:tight adherence protein B
MSELFGELTLPQVITILVVVALFTVSLALLWEGVRRGLRARAATRALRAVANPADRVPAKGEPTRSKLLHDDPNASVPAWIEPVLLRLPHKEDLQRLLEQASSGWSVATVLMVCVGCAVVMGLLTSVLVPLPAAPLAAAAIGAYLPIVYLKIKRHRRFKAFEENFAEAIDLLARAARAGHSLPTGLEVVGQEAEEPVAAEFRQVYEEQRFGLPLKDALLGLADRIDLIDVRIFVTAVLIQRESGGNLAENLDGLSQVIRGRFRFKRDVNTKTAHGRMTGTVVALAPFVAGFGMYSSNPEYMEPLFVEPLGRMMLAVGGVMMLIGFFVIRRITDIKV